MVDDRLTMKMSSVQNNANIQNLQNLLEINSHCYSHFNPWVRTNTTSPVENITLTAGYYYYEIVAINEGGTGFFKIIVDTPEIHGSGTTNPTWQVDRIRINQEAYDSELLKATVYGASGSFKFFYYNSLSELQAAQIQVGASASDFATRIRWDLPNMNYDPVVVRETIDANGVVTTDPAAVEGYIYWITFRMWRGSSVALPNIQKTNVVAGNVPADVTLVRVT